MLMRVISIIPFISFWKDIPMKRCDLPINLSHEKEKLLTMQVHHIPPRTITKAASSPPATGVLLATEQTAATTTSENTTVMIGLILRIGVIASASITLLGLFLLLLQPGAFSPERIVAFPRTPGQEWADLLTLHPHAIIMLGLLLLIATPVFSVAASAVAFARERDRLYMTISLAVLAILLTSLIFGKGIG